MSVTRIRNGVRTVVNVTRAEVTLLLASIIGVVVFLAFVPSMGCTVDPALRMAFVARSFVTKEMVGGTLAVVLASVVNRIVLVIGWTTARMRLPTALMVGTPLVSILIVSSVVSMFSI